MVNETNVLMEIARYTFKHQLFFNMNNRVNTEACQINLPDKTTNARNFRGPGHSKAYSK